MQPTAKILPTLQGRILTLDVLRGIAILGILLANVMAFAWPFQTYAPEMEVILGPTQVAFDSLSAAFVNGKFRGMLAILFGVGIALQFAKRRGIKGAWPNTYFRRTGFLFLFGCLHLFFIWFGDILAMYAILAVFAVLCVGLDDRKLWIWILSLFALALPMAVAVGFFEPLMMQKSAQAPPPFMNEMVVHSTGSYLDQFVLRLVFGVSNLLGVVFFAPSILSLMLFGIWLGRKGVLARPSSHPVAMKRMLLLGLGGGLVLNGGAAAMVGVYPAFSFQMLNDFWAAALLAVGYIAGLTWLIDRTKKATWKPFENVGRTAFSCYILTSLIATTYFYSWGFARYGKADHAEMLIFTGCVWVVLLAFSATWLKFYRMGPLEWLWRSLSTGEKLPIRRGSSDEAPSSTAPPVMPGAPPPIG